MKKVITYGTFDLFHVGHQRLLERAKALGDYLIVGVTSEDYDRERGKLNVRDSLPTRIANVRASGIADEIIVEEYVGQKIGDIIKYAIDVFAIGNDWKGKFDYLKKYCEVVYLDRTKGVSSTELRSDLARILRVGIAADGFSDGDIVAESHFVSGLEVTGACSTAGSEAFCTKYDLGAAYADMPALFAENDLVYVHVRRRYRYAFALEALERGKHVLCDFPFNQPEEAEDLMEFARGKNLALVPRLPLACLRTFRQLIDLLHGGAIGDVLSVECAMPAEPFGGFRDAETLATYAITRILGADAENIARVSVRGRERYDRVVYAWRGAAASCAVSESDWLHPGLTILGTDGRADAPGAWWNLSYFKLQTGGADSVKRFSFNTEGPGLRYLLSETARTIAEGKTDTGMIPPEELLALMNLLERGDLL